MFVACARDSHSSFVLFSRAYSPVFYCSACLPKPLHQVQPECEGSCQAQVVGVYPDNSLQSTSPERQQQDSVLPLP